jgi:hypothetical protein
MLPSYPGPRNRDDLLARWTDFLAEHPGAVLHPPQEPGDPWELDMPPAVILGTDASTVLWTAKRYVQDNRHSQAVQKRA